ncbi:hypothetical protein [Plastoroseomonas arctica]|uniref:hypothetical protein n=1 Tax=Plastoroseomonas arctica TaxID=1509237 RepID=UPI001FECBAA5|nr:hypothetical protein [Plastoroseomonas arctica]
MTEYLGALAARLAIPGLPDWTGLVLLLLVALAGLAFLLMPFSVFGLKGRLDVIEAQLEDLRAELRALPMRLNDAPRPRGRSVEEDWVEPPATPRNTAPPRSAPPVPPPPAWPEARGSRAEPKLDWPPRR